MDEGKPGDAHTELPDEATPPHGMSRKLHEEMRAGYIAVREDREELNRDWSAIDYEGWPD